MSHFGGPLASLRYLAEATGDARLPRWRQLGEVALLYALRGIGPGYYLQARWWRSEIPFADKWNHVNRREYRRFVDRVNPPPYRKASQHKLLEKSVLTLLRIPTPAFLGSLRGRHGVGSDGQPLSGPKDLERLLARCIGSRVCFKPVEGHGGTGFAAFDVAGDNGTPMLVHPLTGERLTVDEWWRSHGDDPEGFIIEEYLTQHPALAALNPSSVNTLRVWVYEKEGAYVVPGAYLRIGRAGSQVDNAAGGGLCCPIDVATGRVREALDITRGSAAHDRHPDSGAALKGFQVPLWPECVDLAGRALAAFPMLRFAGVDIAVSPAQPFMIELNVVPDYIGCARMDLPLRRLARQI